MMDLFFTQKNIAPPGIHFSDFDYIKETYALEVNDICNYYHNRVYAVKNAHLLVRMLQSIDVPMEYEISQYANVATIRAPFIARTFDLTSDVNRGRIFDGVFYGEGSSEILISEEDYFNPFYAEKHWRRICAVKPLLHCKSDLGLLLPNGKFTSTGIGLSAVSINIALLAVQYRSFILSQRIKYDNQGGHLGASHFVHMYVLPNMLYNHVDLAILNRLMNLFYGVPQGDALIRHPMAIIDYTKKVDRVLERCIYSVNKRTLTLDALLKILPAVFSKNQEEVLMMPDTQMTVQSMLKILMVRLPIMRFLLDFSGKRSLGLNRQYMTAIRTKLERLVRQNVISTLPLDLQHEVNAHIDYIMSFSETKA